jgi:hypothetical protein
MGIPVSRRGMRLFNHLIGAHAWRRWHREPEPLAVLALISNSCLVARTGNSPGLSPRRTYQRAMCIYEWIRCGISPPPVRAQTPRRAASICASSRTGRLFQASDLVAVEVS